MRDKHARLAAICWQLAVVLIIPVQIARHVVFRGSIDKPGSKLPRRLPVAVAGCDVVERWVQV